MDAKEFVQEVVVPNCEEFKADPTSFRKLWNAVVSMNTVPEWMAFDRVGYTPLKQSEIETAYKDARKQHPEFGLIKAGTEMLKHVRLLADGEVTVSSTAIQLDDPEDLGPERRPKVTQSRGHPRSSAWGLVFHLPELLRSSLPG